jgi:site-specific recombinase XerD
MSLSEAQSALWLARLQQHCRETRYSAGVDRNYRYAVRRFLRELDRRRQAIESVQATDIERYLDSLKIKRYRGPFPDHSRRMHRAAIRMLLRLVHGKWPLDTSPATGSEREICETVAALDTWMKDLRGLSPSTRRHRREETRRLLDWIHARGSNVSAMTVSDVDAYIEHRRVAMRRNSLAEMIATLRAVLRYLHESGRMPIALASLIRGPAIYALEGIPAVIHPDHVQRALSALKRDRSPLARRDYAVWMLLTTYGLRAGEVIALKLADVDWRHERLRIRHVKTGAYTELPLLAGPADALVGYLRYGRPTSADRAVFLRNQAPYVALRDSSSLHGIVTRRLATVGVVAAGKHGPHALRHARAVSLLRGGVPLKVIGDVLGHRSERSTTKYLKLATEDLRAVALEVPAEVAL